MVVAIGLFAGVILICTGPMYYQLLRVLTLDQTLDNYIDSDSVIIRSITPSFHYKEHNNTNNIFLDQITYNFGDIAKNKPITGLRSPTMFLSKQGYEEDAGSLLLRGYLIPIIKSRGFDVFIRYPSMIILIPLLGIVIDIGKIIGILIGFKKYHLW